MDFSKLENIIFVAASGAIALFLFIMAFYVISKGHRKTSGLDIFLRIVSALVLIVSAGLFALALFTGFTGSFRIAVAGDKAAFIIGDSATELPMGPLFATLATSTGQTIVIALFVIAFMTLVGDCLLAKKKYGNKAKAQKTPKTPEELKREAELQKIKKLSDAAVKKSNSAADKVSATDKKDKAEEKPADIKPDEKKPEEQAIADDEPAFDWRVGEPQKNNEFVGLSNTASDDDSFDTFDDIADGDEEQSEKPNDDFFAEQQEQEENDFTADDDFVSEEEQVEEEVEEEKPWYEKDDPADDERIIAEALSDEPITPSYAQPHEEPIEEQEEQPQADFAESDYFETAEQPQEQEEQAEVPRYEQGDMTAEEIKEQEEQAVEEIAENTAEETEEKPTVEETVEKPQEEDDYNGIEPNRSIYIPGIRTVSRPSRTVERRRESAPTERRSEPEPEAKSEPEQKKPAAARRPVGSRKPAAQTLPLKPEQKKPAQRKAVNKKTESAPSDPKKLPVTRRYVILDRTNAVNIFNNYLKERDKSGKGKLESSINTIIIK